MGHDKANRFTDQLYSVYFGSEDTIAANSRAVVSHLSTPFMPFSTGIHLVDPFSILHPSFSSSCSLCTMSLQRIMNLDAKTTMGITQSRLSLSPLPQPKRQKWLTEKPEKTAEGSLWLCLKYLHV